MHVDMRPAYDSKPSAVTHQVAYDSTNSSQGQSRRISRILADCVRDPLDTQPRDAVAHPAQRKLMEVQAQLRYAPQNQALREECEKLEAMYKGLLAEVGEPHDVVGFSA